MMVGVLLVLLGAAGVSFVGIVLWVVFSHFLTADIPAAISHPMKLRAMDCCLQLLLTWGAIFEKLRICSQPQFIRFMHDLVPLTNDPDVVVRDLHFGTVPVKLYQPKAPSCTLRPGIVFYHGGGGISGSLRTYHKICSHLSKESGSVVVSVGYRMLPKHRFPTAVRDSLAATVHFLRSLSTYSVDPARVVVCGDSMGGGLAMVVCQKLLERPDLPKIRAQILIYAVLQLLGFHTPSVQQNKNVPLLSLNFAFHCWCTYLDISPSWKSVVMKGAHLPAEIWARYRKWLGPENLPERFQKRGLRLLSPEPLNEDAYQETNHVLDVINAPLIAEDEVVSQAPETCFVTCEYDILRDDSLLYKKRLEDLGVSVTWCHMEDGFHGVLNTFGLRWFHFPCSTRVLDAVVHFLKGL